MSLDQLKLWAARVAGAIVICYAYVEWKVIAENYNLEDGVMGTYRPIVLGLIYYVFWVFTRKIASSFSKDTERPNEIALIALSTCISIAVGLFAANFTYVAAIDRPVDTVVAYVLGFTAFMLAAVVVVGSLNKMFEANIDE